MLQNCFILHNVGQVEQKGRKGHGENEPKITIGCEFVMKIPALHSLLATCFCALLFCYWIKIFYPLNQGFPMYKLAPSQLLNILSHHSNSLKTKCLSHKSLQHYLISLFHFALSRLPLTTASIFFLCFSFSRSYFVHFIDSFHFCELISFFSFCRESQPWGKTIRLSAKNTRRLSQRRGGRLELLLLRSTALL